MQVDCTTVTPSRVWLHFSLHFSFANHLPEQSADMRKLCYIRQAHSCTTTRGFCPHVSKGYRDTSRSKWFHVSVSCGANLQSWYQITPHSQLWWAFSETTALLRGASKSGNYSWQILMCLTVWPSQDCEWMFGVGGVKGRQDCLFQRAGNKRIRLQNPKQTTDPNILL